MPAHLERSGEGAVTSRIVGAGAPAAGALGADDDAHAASAASATPNGTERALIA
jgi:hypothetical protein